MTINWLTIHTHMRCDDYGNFRFRLTLFLLFFDQDEAKKSLSLAKVCSCYDFLLVFLLTRLIIVSFCLGNTSGKEGLGHGGSKDVVLNNSFV